MQTLIQKLLAAGPVVTDGAWGTELQARGLGFGEFPDAWNLTNPDRVFEVALAYVQAGSRVILTNTFGANRIRLAETGFEKEVIAINQNGVAISKKAAGPNAFVFASIGPTGKMLLTGDISPAEISDAFEEQALALADAGADALVIETMSDIEEAKIALDAGKKAGLPVIVSMVFDSGKHKDRTMMGETPQQCAEELTCSGADVIGANCGQGIESFVEIARQLRAGTNRPLWIKPNAGLPQVAAGRVIYRATPNDFSLYLPDLLAAGAGFVGGCCGTNPNFIQSTSAALKQPLQTAALPSL